MTLGLHVADYGLVSGAALQFAFNGSDWHAARTNRREHGRWRNDEAFTFELVVRAGFVLADDSVSGAGKKCSFQPRWRYCWDRIRELRTGDSRSTA